MSYSESNVERTADTPAPGIPTYGRKPALFFLPFLPSDQVQPILYIALASFVVGGGFGLPLQYCALVMVWFCVIWVALTGFRPWLFTNRFVRLPGAGYLYQPYKFFSLDDSEVLLKKTLSKRKKMITVKNQLGKLKAFRQFQADCDLHGIMEIQLKETVFSVFLLCDAKGHWFASIPFDFGGIHAELYDESVVSTVDAITTFADYLIPGERITFYGGKRTQARRRNQYLSQLRQKSRSRLPINALLTEAERQRMLQLTQKGLRQEWEQKIFCTWHQSRASTRQFDWLGNIINGVAQVWQGFSRTFTGTKDYYQRLTYARLAEDISKTGFIPSMMLLKHRGNLDVSPLLGVSAWEWLWYRFNPANSLPPPIPQLIKVTENELGQFETEVIRHSQNDILSVLLAGSYGKSGSSLPVVHDKRDSLFFNGNYIAAMSLDGGIKQEGKPRSYGTLRTQLRYMFDHLCAPGVRDTEFWVELEPANKTQVRDDLSNTTKQSSASNKYAAQKGEVVNVEATLQQSESLEAQKLLAKGRQPISVGFSALVYRKNLSELDRACQQLAHHFGSVKLIREEQVCWKRWLETLPITTARILTSTCEGVLTFDPRLVFPSSEIPGLLPITLPQPLEKSPTGIEFLCHSQPIYVDVSRNVYNVLICGKKGSGKSSMTFPFIRHALNYGPVLGMDMSLGGDSTFKLICDLYGDRAAYYDLTTTRNNALLYPDLRALPPSEKEKRFGFWKIDTIEFLVALTLGTLNDPFLEQRVRNLIQKAFDAFLADPSIQRRYELAIASGHGTNAWLNQPTLRDFIPYCTVERLGLFDASDLDKRSLNQIRTMCEAKLNDPNIGKVIGYPTEVSTDADLVFFSLAGLNDPTNALIMALIAQKLCFTLGLSHDRSLLAIDECSTILRTSPAFARLIGQRFAVGRKFGQGSMLIGQDLDSVLRTETASQILDNLDITLIGLINAQAAQTYHSKLNIPKRLINQNTSSKYRLWKEEMISHWLLGYNQMFWQVDYASSLLELATLANQPDEKKLKQQYLSSSPTPSEVIDFCQVYADKFLKQVS
ncbi:hypothetical protein [Crocosphaera chwakensis]|uniref:Uncharacterized protein n=1 Tax=Crocosphaera chwakensis CCY0110 TaxID=391612 RepID=A3IZL0_9CHRO|nr:hypothetical protein [Crocosphaera chwakensis]EAZ88083.1 hypothetical protein CY0110_14710 [Crocosphaera chwakensis CCY0110]